MEDIDRTLGEAGERRETVGGGKQPPPAWKNVLFGLLLTLLASFPLWPSWAHRLGLIGVTNGEITSSVPHAVEVVDTGNHKTYVVPSQFKVSTVPDVLEVKAVPGTAGAGYGIEVAGKSYTGNVYPGKTDKYMVIRTQDGDIDFIKLSQSQSRPALGGQE